VKEGYLDLFFAFIYRCIVHSVNNFVEKVYKSGFYNFTDFCNKIVKNFISHSGVIFKDYHCGKDYLPSLIRSDKIKPDSSSWTTFVCRNLHSHHYQFSLNSPYRCLHLLIKVLCRVSCFRWCQIYCSICLHFV